jgi:hypothetical protein
MRRLALPVVWTTVLLGVLGSAVALRSRGSEELFRYTQSRALGADGASVLSAAHVEEWVAKAPEPVRPAQRTAPTLTRCRPGGGGVLRNPWSCTVRYRSGKRADYRVLVQPDGFYRGVGAGIIEGCCVRTPASR